MQPFLDLATEAILRIDANLPIPAFDDILLHLATHRLPITREGTERLMDAMFASQPAALLEDPASHQTTLGDQLTAVATPAFMAYWTYIILPAWDHHVTIYRLCKK